MPIYEMYCPKEECQLKVEHFIQLAKLNEPVVCPQCGAEMKRLMSHTEFRMHPIKER